MAVRRIVLTGLIAGGLIGCTALVAVAFRSVCGYEVAH